MKNNKPDLIVMDNKYYSVKSLSRMTGLKDYAVREYIRKKKLKGIKIGRHWWVSEKRLNEFLDPWGK